MSINDLVRKALKMKRTECLFLHECVISATVKKATKSAPSYTEVKNDIARQLDIYPSDLDAMIFGLGLQIPQGVASTEEQAKELRNTFKVV